MYACGSQVVARVRTVTNGKIVWPAAGTMLNISMVIIFCHNITVSGFAIFGFKVRLSLDLPADKTMVMMETPNGSKEDAGHPQLIS